MELKFSRPYDYSAFAKFFSLHALDPIINNTKNSLLTSLKYCGVKKMVFFVNSIYEFNTEGKKVLAKRNNRFLLSINERYRIMKYFIRVIGHKGILPDRAKHKVLVFDPFDNKFVKIDRLITNE